MVINSEEMKKLRDELEKIIAAEAIVLSQTNNVGVQKLLMHSIRIKQNIIAKIDEATEESNTP